MTRRSIFRNRFHESPRARLLSILICLSSLLSTLVVVTPRPLVTAKAQPQARKGKPDAGPPAANLPNLDEVRRTHHHVPEAPAPIPSTLRSRRNPLMPRNGLKVGDPGTTGSAITGSAGVPPANLAEAHAALATISSQNKASAVARRLRAGVLNAGGSSTPAGLPGRGPRTPALPVTSKRNHARARAAVAAPVADDWYLQNFFSYSLLRQANSTEQAYFDDILRVANAHGQSSMVMAVREMGKTIFESAEYAARSTSNHVYVQNLYETYLMREPDSGGWSFWESLVPGYGREAIRRAFDESGEFIYDVSTITPNGNASSSVSSLVSARVDPFNQSGNQVRARDAEWNVMLLSLRGRAGLDLGLGLSYSSAAVYTRSGPYLYFDEDNGWPSPGFKLGFPTIQELYFDAQVGANVYVLITSAGSRVELRQVGTTNVYEAADSSYLQLTDNSAGNLSTLLLRTTDGTQMSYIPENNEWRCNQIKDRNGNYITVNYDWLGHITTIVDTLSRTITFNYDGNANLQNITQSWQRDLIGGGQSNEETHTWAQFYWGTATVQPNISGVSLTGAASGESIPVINQVSFPDGSLYTFEYNGAAQVSTIRRKNPSWIERSHMAFDYGASDDSTRLTATRVAADNWTGINGVPSEVTTTFGYDGGSACWTVAPDGTVYKEFYGAGWQKRLPQTTEIWSANGTKQKWTTTSWTHDGATNASYPTNPRMTETNIYDSNGNHRRTKVGDWASISLPGGPTCTLPSDVYEYDANGSTVLRRSHREYNTASAYLDRRIIGLTAAKYICDGSLGEVSWSSISAASILSKVTFQYDEANSVEYQGAPTQHDSAFDSTTLPGRGNLTSVSRYDVTPGSSQFLTSSIRYNTAGSVIRNIDPLGHQSNINYSDSFSDGNNRNTFAYPTTVTDPDGFSSTAQYNYYLGAVFRVQGPPPANPANNGQPYSQWAAQKTYYDSAGRVERTVNEFNGAYTRYDYGYNYVQSYSTVNNVADEAYSIQFFDGFGRTIMSAGLHPGSTGGFSAVATVYDQMGRTVKQSNPTETNGTASSWAAAGDDAVANGGYGWQYTTQTYDWKGRPLVTRNTDLTQKSASYSGCGCAGGEVVTLTDEGTIDPVSNMVKKRQQRIYHDVLGRVSKTEVLNWDGNGPNGTNGTVYSATVNTYNARDQIAVVRQWAGAENASVAYQDTTMTYDGYARLKTKHAPEQQVDPNNSASTDHTTWVYNADDTIYSVTDARGASAAYSYNARHLVTGIAYNAPSSIAIPAGVSYVYDAAGNRISMTDGLGSVSYGYDQLSRLTSESRYFSQLNRFYEMDYGYNLAGELASVSLPTWSQQVSYNHDAIGRLSSVGASGYNSGYLSGNSPNLYWVNQPVSSFVSSISYRAWGAVKQMTYGNGVQSALNYNARQQATRFELSNFNTSFTFTAGSNYDYYPDGKIHTASNLADNRFDRNYTYDHAGRTQDALTGSEARGGSTADGPYREGFSYDAWSNSVSETKRFWSGSTTTNNTTVTNNRRNNFSYDANGFATHYYDDQLDYNSYYDASGKRNHLIPDLGWFNGQPAVEMYDTFDGDGQPNKRVDTRRAQDPDGYVYTLSNTTTFYLHATALGGQVVAQLDSQGNKTNGYVYVQGMQFATEFFVNTVGGIHPVIFWQSINPVTGGKLTSDILRNFAVARELDPLGSDVTTEPPPDPQSYQPPIYSVPEEPVAKLLDFDANDDIPDWYLNMAHAESDRKLAQWFWDKGYRDRAQQIIAHNPNVGITGDDVDTAAKEFHLQLEDGALWGADAAAALGIIRTPKEIASEAADPQNTIQERDPRDVPNRKLAEAEVDRLRKAFAKIIGKRSCEEFIDSLLSEAAALYPGISYSDDMMYLFDSVGADGGFYLAPTASYSTVINGTMYIAYDDPRDFPLNPKDYPPARFRAAALGFIDAHFSGMAAIVTHELLHYAGFNDWALAQAVASIKGERVSFPSGREGTYAASRYWNAELLRHCQ
jgi:YD repeat-containing protein